MPQNSLSPCRLGLGKHWLPPEHGSFLSEDWKIGPFQVKQERTDLGHKQVHEEGMIEFLTQPC